VALPTWAADEPAGPQHNGSVVRAVFTTQVENREPVEDRATFATDVGEIIHYTELRDLAGHTVTHRWEYNNQVMGEVTFKVDGPRWRVWSRKTMLPQWTGQWTVVVVDEAGWPLKASIFEYTEAGQ
jgi:hypothetical protein